jgi:uncharacterized protein
LYQVGAASGVLKGMETRIVGTVERGIAALLIAVLRIYQYLISPLLGTNCRFLPGCSHYAVEAVQRHGPWTGMRLTLRRLARCHPWGGHGYDPVPR